MAQIGKIIVDFQVYDLENPQVLIVEDSSIWLHIEDKIAVIEILMPGQTTPIVHTFNKGGRNTFNSNILIDPPIGNSPQSTLSDLPDGVYTITVKGSPDSFNKCRKFLKTSTLELEMKKLLVTEGLQCKNVSQDFLNKHLELSFLLKSAKANIAFDNGKTAFELYNRALDMLEDLKRCRPCVGAEGQS